MSDGVKKTKPVAGALWGLLLGTGLALLAIDRRIVSLGIAPFLVLVVVGIAVGVAWSLFGPAKGASDTAATDT